MQSKTLLKSHQSSGIGEPKENFVVSANSEQTTTETALVECSESQSAAEQSAGSDHFELIRQLDEKERWCDRNIVITSVDHKQNRELVTGIVDSVIDNLPLG